MTIPYFEKVVSDYLREDAALAALGVRVVGKTPSSTTEPWIRVTQLDARSDHRSDHLVEFYAQFDCYAGAVGGQPEANDLARATREALVAMPGTHDGSVVSGVEIRGHARIPDLEVDEPQRERFVISAVVWMH